MKEELFRVEGLTLIEHGTQILSNATFYIRTGDLIGVLGQYTSGKRALAQAVCGMRDLRNARVYLREQPVESWNSIIAKENGFFYIKDLQSLFLEQDVAFNVLLKPHSGVSMWLNQKRLHRQCSQLLKELAIKIEENIPVKQLSYAEQLMVLIVKAVAQNATLLVLDNIVSTINESQLKNFIDLFQRLTSRGISIILADGDVETLMRLSEHIVVVREDRIASRCSKELFNAAILSTIMVGKKPDIQLKPKTKAENSKIKLQLFGKSANKSEPLFSVYEGAFSGILVFSEADISRLSEIFSGKDSEYQIIMDEKKLKRQDLKSKIGIVNEHTVIFPNLSLKENITLQYQKVSSLLGWIRGRKTKAAMNNRCKEHFCSELRALHQKDLIANLARGDKKILEICRMLICQPEVAVYVNPMYRLDSIFSKRLLTKIQEIQETGLTSVLISNNIHICCAVCNDIFIFTDNKFRGHFSTDEYGTEELLQLYLGNSI